MRNTLSQKQLGVLSIIVLFILGSLFIYVQMNTKEVTGISNKASRLEQREERERLSAAEDAVKALEKQQTKNNLDKAQSAVDALKLTSASTKANLQSRIDKIAKIIDANEALEAAEKALDALEKELTQANLEKAIEAVGEVSNETSRSKLQAKLSSLEEKVLSLSGTQQTIISNENEETKTSNESEVTTGSENVAYTTSVNTQQVSQYIPADTTAGQTEPVATTQVTEAPLPVTTEAPNVSNTDENGTASNTN